MKCKLFLIFLILVLPLIFAADVAEIGGKTSESEIGSVGGVSSENIGSISGVTFVSCTDLGICYECIGGAATMPADDALCGIIDCDLLDNYYTSGIASITGINYCRFEDYDDLVTNRCALLSVCKDSSDCGSPAGDTVVDTCGICEYATGACSSCSDYTIGTDSGLCRECTGSNGGEQVPADDSGCGTIDCSSYYWGWSADICYYRADITNNRCEGIGDCKEASDCPSQGTGGVQNDCTGTCEVAGSGCSSTTAGSCGMPADDDGCGIIDCDGLNYYWTSGSASVTGTNYCEFLDYEDIITDRCEGVGDCKDVNSGDCIFSSSNIVDTCGICEYASGACSSCYDYGSGTDSGLCRECTGSNGGEQMSTDDAACGTISCSSYDYYYTSGSVSVTGTNYCRFFDYADITSNRCEGIGNCKESSDCDDPGDTTTSDNVVDTCGLCEYASGACSSCYDYSSGTDSGLCRECTGSNGGEQVSADDPGCGTIDCDGLNFYYASGTASATGTNYCEHRDYADLTSNRCEGLSNCKDANTGDCTSYSDSIVVTCGLCKAASGDDCNLGCNNYASGTSCGSGLECDGAGNCVTIVSCDSTVYQPSLTPPSDCGGESYTLANNNCYITSSGGGNPDTRCYYSGESPSSSVVGRWGWVATGKEYTCDGTGDDRCEQLTGVYCGLSDSWRGSSICYRRFNLGECFEENTLVTMKDGTTKNIQEMVVGDEIKAFDEEKDKVGAAIVENIYHHDEGMRNLDKVSFSNEAELTVTPNHPILNSKREWIKVKDLKVGDIVYQLNANNELEEVQVLSIIREYSEESTVYNIKTSLHNYFAEDILVHNKCVRFGTLIDTPSGLVPVQELKVGDLVYGTKNGVKIETKILKTYEKEVITSIPGKILLNGEIVTNNHLIEYNGEKVRAGETDLEDYTINGEVYDLQTEIGDYYVNGIRTWFDY